VHNMSWHLTFICCTSQAPHWCNTLLFLLLCKFLALIGLLIFKIRMHILRGVLRNLLIFIVYLLYDLSVLSSITKKGEIEEYLGPLSGFWWFNDTHLSS
jgi:hypothetical protein